MAKWLLRDSITISASGRIFKFSESQDINSFFASVGANSGLTIHAPDEAVAAEVQLLVEYEKSIRLKDTYARFGKTVSLPPTPKLRFLYDNKCLSREALEWLLEHCSRLCIWNRFTEYGVQPTVITNDYDAFELELRTYWSNVSIPYEVVSTERELPTW